MLDYGLILLSKIKKKLHLLPRPLVVGEAEGKASPGSSNFDFKRDIYIFRSIQVSFLWGSGSFFLLAEILAFNKSQVIPFTLQVKHASSLHTLLVTLKM